MRMRLRVGRGRDDRRGVLPPAAVSASGLAVRRDWPDGTHDFVGYTADVGRALRRLARDVRYWRRGPVRPWSRLVVSLPQAAFRSHRQWCTAADCPGAAVVRRGAEVTR